MFNYQRRKTIKVQVGQTTIGGDSPIRLQSMTTSDTNDTNACVAQCKAVIDAGGELVRLTTQGTREAENLRSIREKLNELGYAQPLVADVHFNPNVADVAAGIIEKVRINPGNYVDPARKFLQLEYTDEEYQAELRRLEERFLKLLQICREHHTALRIGVNHGSLSDRIMSRYGDTPEGIVESCMEFLRICVKEKFYDVVISIKASNTVVMVRSVRLLCHVMQSEGMQFPLHLGVTEAGEGEDGRIKSAVGIGALLADGIGDTIRVSLSEPPECEIPVAKKVVRAALSRVGHENLDGLEAPDFNYLNPERRPTNAVLNIGGNQEPVVISVRLNGENDFAATKPDYIYCGENLPAECEENIGYIVDFHRWNGQKNVFPAYNSAQLMAIGACNAPLKFVFCQREAMNEEMLACLKAHPEVVLIIQSTSGNRMSDQRAIIHALWRAGLGNPAVVMEQSEFSSNEMEDFQITNAVEAANLLFDGLADGIMLFNQGDIPCSAQDDTAFSILQATRRRTTKTEYISCPGCGRTLYDLRSTIAKIREATAHLKGLKIGIMGCIVNGPGEMADADYGYVGAGRGKISLYKGKVCVERNIPEAEAVERLLKFIEDDRK